jgi:hypothetical protein
VPAGYLIYSALTAALLAVLVAALGRVAYGVPAQRSRSRRHRDGTGRAVACCALAFAITVMIREASTATALVPALTLTLFFLSGFFLSGNFFSLDSAPAGRRTAADVFPVRPSTWPC